MDIEKPVGKSRPSSNFIQNQSSLLSYLLIVCVPTCRFVVLGNLFCV